MKFKQGKCGILHLGWGNSAYTYKLGDERLESSPTERELGVLVGEQLNMGHQFTHSTESLLHPGQGKGFSLSTLFL